MSSRTDLELAATKAGGVHTPRAEIPDPGTFVVNREGVVLWRQLGDAHTARERA